MEMGELLLHDFLGGGTSLDIWEVLRYSGTIFSDVRVRDMGVNTLHT